MFMNIHEAGPSNPRKHDTRNAQLLLEELQAMVATEDEMQAKPGKPEVEFLYVHHIPEFAAQIADELKDKNVVLLEDISKDRETRERFDYLFNVAMEPDLPPETYAEISKLLNTTDDHGEPIFKFELIKALRGSGKLILLIDAFENDPAMADLTQNYEQTQHELFQELRAFSRPPELRDYMSKFAYAVGEEIAYRDQLVIAQIQAVVEGGGLEGKPLKVGIVQGAVHTPSYHHFSRKDDVDSSRKFIGEQATHPRSKFPYTYTNEVFRDVSIAATKSLSEDKLNRAILELYVLQNLPDRDLVAIREKISKLTEEEANSLLEKIHRAGTSRGRFGAFKSAESIKEQQLAQVKSILQENITSK